MAEFVVTRSKDGLRGYLLVPPSFIENYPTANQLRATLTQHGIVNGVLDEAIEEMVGAGTCNAKVLVAEGTPPDPGKPGELKMLIDISACGKPRESADGRVDLRDLQKLLNVKMGQGLIRRIPPVLGNAGRSVMGESISPPKEKDVKLLGGEGTMISEEDENLLVAKYDGAVMIDSNGVIEVARSKVINGDVDYSTGNVSFAGDLRVTGTIRAGFSVKADGDIIIGGSVEDTQIVCKGNVAVAGGAFGSGNGKIQCDKNLRIQHVEHFNVHCGGEVVVVEDIVHSNVTASGMVRARAIVGGAVSGGAGVEVEISGAPSEPKTVLDAGGTHKLTQEKGELLRNVGHAATDLATAKEELYVAVRDRMGAEGHVQRNDEVEIAELQQKRRELQKEYDSLAMRVEEIDKELEGRPVAVIKIQQAMPNTVVQFGPSSKTIKTQLHKVILTMEDGKIKIIKT